MAITIIDDAIKVITKSFTPCYIWLPYLAIIALSLVLLQFLIKLLVWHVSAHYLFVLCLYSIYKCPLSLLHKNFEKNIHGATHALAALNRLSHIYYALAMVGGQHATQHAAADVVPLREIACWGF